MKKTLFCSLAVVSALVLSSCSIGFKEPEIVTDKYDFDEDFEKIKVSISCEDVHIMASEDDDCHIVFSHPSDRKSKVEVENDTLVVDEKTNFVFNSWGTDMKDTKLDIYLPESEFKRADFDVASADIVVDEGFEFDVLDIDIASGNVNIGDMKLQTLDIDSASGSILLTNVISDSISIDIASGNIEFDHCDAENIKIDSASGNITGTLLSGKDFDVDALSGDINVPKDSEGGTCEINIASGNVNLEVV